MRTKHQKHADIQKAAKYTHIHTYQQRPNKNCMFTKHSRTHARSLRITPKKYWEEQTTTTTTKERSFFLNKNQTQLQINERENAITTHVDIEKQQQFQMKIKLQCQTKYWVGW